MISRLLGVPAMAAAVLFEVKTDLTTTSIYKGLGQLMLHGAQTDPPPRRILVVPGGPTSDTRVAFDRLGVRVVSYVQKDERTCEFSGLEDALAP